MQSSKLQFKIQNYRRGFTLIELMIYTALFTIVLAIAIDFFFLSKTIATEVAQYQEVDRNARVALLDMTQTIRGTSSVSSPALGSSGVDLYLNGSTIRYFVNGSGILQKTESGQTYDLTSDSVLVSNLSFTTRGEVGEKPTVSISFQIRTNTRVYGRPDYITKDFQTTVQVR